MKILEAAASIAVPPALLGQLMSLAGNVALNVDSKQKIDRLLSNNVVALRAVHQAASWPRSRFPIDSNIGAAYRPLHHHSIYQLALLTRAEALLRANAGDVASAVESIAASFGLARTLAADLNTSAAWIRSMCLQLIGSSLEELLGQHQVSKTDLKRLLRLLSDVENESKFDRVLAGQRAVDLTAYYLPQELFYQVTRPDLGREQSILFSMIFRALRMTGIRDLDSLSYVNGADEWMAMSRLNYPERLTKAKELDQRFETYLSRRPHFMLSRKLRSIAESEAGFAEKAAYLRAAQAALAIEGHRLEKGQLPVSLDDLAPRFIAVVPTDPFDGRPLRYKRLEKGYTIYSIGRDSADNGGKETKRRTRVMNHQDITFTVAR